MKKKKHRSKIAHREQAYIHYIIELHCPSCGRRWDEIANEKRAEKGDEIWS